LHLGDDWLSDRLDGLIKPMRTKGPTIDLDRLLDAAEAVVLRLGVTGLTLDAVAAQAGVSKGGLLYHFPSKERLIAAMVGRIASLWRNDFRAAIESVPPGPGRVPRGCLNTCFECDPSQWSDCIRRASVVLLAALTANPELVQPMRAAHAEIDDLVRHDGLKEGYAETVLAAVDGLWFSRVFGLRTWTPDQVRAMRQVLEAVVEQGIGNTAGTAARAPAATAGPGGGVDRSNGSTQT
jgi:AcrR family transcriptional regulator